MKPWIANKVINIRRMQRGTYEIINTAYDRASNHKDAIPAGQNDTRYFPLFSRWQTKEAIDKFNELHPNYYTDLYGTLDHAGALRKWLMEYEISDAFDPMSQGAGEHLQGRDAFPVRERRRRDFHGRAQREQAPRLLFRAT
jgi:hypothetical protein